MATVRENPFTRSSFLLVRTILLPADQYQGSSRRRYGPEATAFQQGAEARSSRLGVDRIITEIQLSFNIPITETSTETLEPLPSSIRYSYFMQLLQRGRLTMLSTIREEKFRLTSVAQRRVVAISKWPFRVARR